MELAYNLAIFVFAVVFLGFISGLVRPSILHSFLRKWARRKYILTGGLILVIALSGLISAIEPASVKQARLERDRIAQEQKASETAKQSKIAELKKQEEKPKESSKAKPKTKAKPKPTCDGKKVTSNCAVDGVSYKKYIYHAAIAEKSHAEQVTTYQKQVTGYCTLCQDGTYSPSCATGRGACSHHGGVAQWNAPRYSNVPVYSTKVVVDAPAIDAYTEKIRQ